jgi:hypothetical protein
LICDNNCWSSPAHKIGSWGGSSGVAFNTWKSQSGKDAHSIEANPLFVNPAARDFHLQSTSPCKGTGYGGVDMGIYP